MAYLLKEAKMSETTKLLKFCRQYIEMASKFAHQNKEEDKSKWSEEDWLDHLQGLPPSGPWEGIGIAEHEKQFWDSLGPHQQDMFGDLPKEQRLSFLRLLMRADTNTDY